MGPKPRQAALLNITIPLHSIQQWEALFASENGISSRGALQKLPTANPLTGRGAIALLVPRVTDLIPMLGADSQAILDGVALADVAKRMASGEKLRDHFLSRLATCKLSHIDSR